MDQTLGQGVEGRAVAGVLAGVRVLDFGRYVAAPYCAALLGDLGADVIRIERPGGGEDRYITPLAEDGSGPCFLQSNRSKRGITLNLQAPGSREVVQRLASTAQVVLVNLPPAAAAQLGLDYETLRGIKPDIIVTSITAFGEHGPYRDRVGFDGIAQAMSGAVYVSGSVDQPQRCLAPYVDYGAALAATVGTLAAIMEHRRSGQGQHVTADLYGTALNFASMQLIEEAVTGVGRPPSGNRSPAAAPVDLFRCSDGWVMASVVGEALWRRWTDMVGAQDWQDDPRFANDIARGAHGELLCERMARWCATRTVVQAMTECHDRKIPCGAVYPPARVLRDPHVLAAGYLLKVPYPGIAEPVPVPAPPFQLSRTEARLRARAPTLGEHTAAVLAELGFGPADMEQLRAGGVV